MTRQEILQKLYDQAMNNVFAYSADYLMTTPKKGYEREFEEAQEIAAVLKTIME